MWRWWPRSASRRRASARGIASRGALAHLKAVDARSIAAAKGKGGAKGGGGTSLAALARPASQNADADADADNSAATAGGRAAMAAFGPKVSAKRQLDDPTADDRSAEGFAARWLGCRDLMRAHVAVLLATRDKERRAELKRTISALDGRLMLIRELQEACSDWPPIAVPGRGGPEAGGRLVDARWNMGLEEEEEEEGGRAPDRSVSHDPQRMVELGRVCYHCASLQPPIKVVHRFVECPKRRKANRPEVVPDAMQRITGRFDQDVGRSRLLLAEFKSSGKASAAAGDDVEETARGEAPVPSAPLLLLHRAEEGAPRTRRRDQGPRKAGCAAAAAAPAAAAAVLLARSGVAPLPSRAAARDRASRQADGSRLPRRGSLLSWRRVGRAEGHRHDDASARVPGGALATRVHHCGGGEPRARRVPFGQGPPPAACGDRARTRATARQLGPDRRRRRRQ